MRLWVTTLFTLAATTSAGYIVGHLLFREGVPRRDLLFIAEFLVGIVAGALVFVLGRQQEQRAKFVNDRLRVIAEMNHHIRNALQVITFHTHTAKDDNALSEMHDAVSRITWALGEVRPQIPDLDETRKGNVTLPKQSPTRQANRRE